MPDSTHPAYGAPEPTTKRWPPSENCYCGGPEEIYPHRKGTGYYCGREVSAPRTPAPDDVSEEFDGCARECRKAGAHTHVWGRCGEAPEPTPPSKDDLRGLLIAAGLVSHVQTMDDGCNAVVVHSDEEAADRALAVFQQWMFGTPVEVAAREREAANKKPDDPAAIRARIVGLCEKNAPGEHARRALNAAADQLDAMPETDGAALKGPYWYRDGWKQATGMLRDWADYPAALADRIARGEI